MKREETLPIRCSKEEKDDQMENTKRKNDQMENKSIGMIN